MSILAWIVVGIAAGWLVKSVAPGEGLGGFVGDLVVGVTGAVTAGWIFDSFSNPTVNPLGGSIVVAFVGAAAFLWTARVLAKRWAKARV